MISRLLPTPSMRPTCYRQGIRLDWVSIIGVCIAMAVLVIRAGRG